MIRLMIILIITYFIQLFCYCFVMDSFDQSVLKNHNKMFVKTSEWHFALSLSINENDLLHL